MKSRVAYVIALLAAAALAPSARVLAADGEVTVGTQDWDQTVREAKFEEFRDIPHGPFVESFVYLDTWKGGRFAMIGNDALQNDQATTVLYRRPRWTASLDYNQVPHNFSFIARSPYTEVAPGVFSLPDSLQRANQQNSGAYVNTMTDRMKTAPIIPLGFRTDQTRARLKGRLGNGLQFDLRGQRRQRDGTKAFGASFGFSNAVEITEPIRQTTEQGEARASLVRNRATFEVVGGVDQFENDVDVLIVDNPRRYTDSPSAGSSRAQLDLYPDNRTLRGSAGLSLQMPRRTALTAMIGVSSTRQDDRWRRLTINTAILQPDSFPLPGTNTDGKLVAVTEDVRLTSSALGRLAGTLRFRRHDVDNKTPERTITGQVAYDQSWQPAAVTTHPLGTTNTTFGADADFTVSAKASLSGTVERVNRERTYREVAEDHETVFIGKARYRPRAGVELTGKYRHGDRKLDHFEEEDYENAAGAFVEQPTLRRFDVGDRQQEAAGITAGWAATERLTASAGYEYQRSKYQDRDLADLAAPFDPDTSETQLGLLDETRRNISGDLTYEASDRLSITGGYGWVQVYTNQRSRESGAALARNDSTTWQARVKDWFVYANGAVTWQARPNRLAIVATYEFDRSPGIYHLTNFRGNAVDLPGSIYRRESVGAEAWYQVDRGTSLGLRWAWERFNVSDYATENVPVVFPVTGASTALFLGDSIQDYDAHQVGVLLRKTF